MIHRGANCRAFLDAGHAGNWPIARRRVPRLFRCATIAVEPSCLVESSWWHARPEPFKQTLHYFLFFIFPSTLSRTEVARGKGWCSFFMARGKIDRRYNEALIGRERFDGSSRKNHGNRWFLGEVRSLLFGQTNKCVLCFLFGDSCWKGVCITIDSATWF